jgi:hypothetical protein
MADMSDIEDGFALKRQRDKARGGPKKRSRAARGEHIIPPSPAKHILASYTLANPTNKRAVSDYVEVQAREKVLHAEKVKTEHMLGRDHGCWDVHTNKDRYWVITAPTNLYSQHYFPSVDFTLSFHIGVCTRVMARARGAPDDAQKARLTPVWRRWEQAADTPDMAEEAEDFQTVGMKCRECLIQLVRSLADLQMVPAGQDPAATQQLHRLVGADCQRRRSRGQRRARSMAPEGHSEIGVGARGLAHTREWGRAS